MTPIITAFERSPGRGWGLAIPTGSTVGSVRVIGAVQVSSPPGERLPGDCGNRLQAEVDVFGLRSGERAEAR